MAAIPELLRRSTWDDPEKEYVDLSADWRWGQLRGLVGVLKAAKRYRHDIIPWDKP